MIFKDKTCRVFKTAEEPTAYCSFVTFMCIFCQIKILQLILFHCHLQKKFFSIIVLDISFNKLILTTPKFILDFKFV